MTLSLPLFNPNAGRLGALLESLAGNRRVGQGRAATDGPPSASSSDPLPMSMADAEKRGWHELDVVFITGDAYIDHPSFAMAILGRVLEAAGFRVGIVIQPDWRKVDDWRRFGRPRLLLTLPLIDVATPVANAAGDVDLPLPVPADSSLAGLTAIFQVFGVQGLALVGSEALAVRLCP